MWGHFLRDLTMSILVDFKTLGFALGEYLKTLGFALGFLKSTEILWLSLYPILMGQQKRPLLKT